MKTLDRLLERVRQVLVRALPRGVTLDVVPRSGGLTPTFDVTCTAAATAHRFVVGWAGEGWPADVERLATLAPDVDVVIAANLSRGARAWLSSEELGWIDEVGRADVRRPSGLVIVREPAEPSRRTTVTEKWNRSMLAVAEAALSGTAPTVARIEAVTGLSRNASASALLRLEQLGHLRRPGARRGPNSRRSIDDPAALLNAYADAAANFRAKQPPTLIHRTWRDPLEALHEEIGPALDAGRSRWALTGAGASTLLAPYLSAVTTLELYVDAALLADPARLESALGGRIVQKGHRIAVREFPTEMRVDGPMIEGIRLALPVRIYADLVAVGGRSDEAAHHLKEVHQLGTNP